MKRHQTAKNSDKAATQKINNKSSMKRHCTAESSDNAATQKLKTLTLS